MNHLSSRARRVGFSLFAALLIGILYQLPHLLIRRQLAAQKLHYAPITERTDPDESRIYAPQIEEVAGGNYRYGDPALLEHTGDPTLLRPLGPWVLGTLSRVIGLERFWFLSDALLPPLIFLLILVALALATRSFPLAFWSAGIMIFFREAASFIPFSLYQYFRTFVANLLPIVVSSRYDTHLAFGRLLTPQWTFIPLSSFFVLWFMAIRYQSMLASAAAGLVAGLLWYSYPFDAISVALLLAMQVFTDLTRHDRAALKRTVVTIITLAMVAVPYALTLRLLVALPHYQELLARTGLEVGRVVRASLIPHYLLWVGLAGWLLTRKNRTAVDGAAAAIFLAAIVALNIQLVTGFVPRPLLFLDYSLTLPLAAAYLIVSRRLWITQLQKTPRIRRALSVVGLIILASVIIRNIQIPFGYARQHATDFTIPSDVVAGLAWLHKNGSAKTVVLSPETLTNTLLLVHTPVKTFFPPTGIISSAGNRELVERFVVAAKIFGANDDLIRHRFEQETAALILHNDIYRQDPDHTYRAELRPLDDMKNNLNETLNDWQTNQRRLLQRYAAHYVWVGPAEQRSLPSPLEARLRCLNPVFAEGSVTIYRFCDHLDDLRANR